MNSKNSIEDFEDYEEMVNEIRLLTKAVKRHLDHVAEHVETMMREAEDQNRRRSDAQARRHFFMIMMLLLQMKNQSDADAHSIKLSHDEYESAPAPRRMR